MLLGLFFGLFGFFAQTLWSAKIVKQRAMRGQSVFRDHSIRRNEDYPLIAKINQTVSQSLQLPCFSQFLL